MKWIKKIFQKKPKPILLDGKYKIVPAFELLGETYYMHEDPLNVLAGRGLSAITHLEELLMRCSAEYLNAHIEAVEKILSDPKKINIGKLYILNNNLRERVSLAIALPKHVFKLASVVFFTKDESPFMYDSAAANKRIKTWVEADGMYDFFLQRTPLKTLVPFLQLPDSNSKNYLAVQEKINQLHLKPLSEILSRPASTIDI